MPEVVRDRAQSERCAIDRVVHPRELFVAEIECDDEKTDWRGGSSGPRNRKAKKARES